MFSWAKYSVKASYFVMYALENMKIIIPERSIEQLYINC